MGSGDGKSLSAESVEGGVMDYKYVIEEAMAKYQPIQCPDELLAAMNVVGELKPRCIVELGTYRGGSLRCWTACATDDAIVIGTDTVGTPTGTVEALQSWLKPTQAGYFLLGDLKTKDFHERIISLLEGRSVDFLFLDDSHDYDTVAWHWKSWLPKMRKGGMIGVHDIEKNNPPNIETLRFWNEIVVPNYPDHKELIIPATFGVPKERMGITYGIGLVIV